MVFESKGQQGPWMGGEEETNHNFLLPRDIPLPKRPAANMGSPEVLEEEGDHNFRLPGYVSPLLNQLAGGLGWLGLGG